MESLSIYFKFFLLTALGIIQVKTEIFRNGRRRDGKFKLVERNVRLDVDVASTIVAQSLSICAKACVDNIVCNSFNYNTNSKLCEVLLETRSMVGDSKLITASSWKHYEPVKQAQPECQRFVDSNSCGPHQKCEHDCSHNQTERFKCVGLENIAFGKTTKNEPFDGTPPSRAVDGNTETNFLQHSCAHTSCCAPLPWWRVDFGKTAAVYSMKITNRGDCCGERLSNFNVRIGDSTLGRGDENVACQMNASVPQGATSIFVCDPRLYGRYLYVQSNLNLELTLCEVEVFGEIL